MCILVSNGRPYVFRRWYFGLVTNCAYKNIRSSSSLALFDVQRNYYYAGETVNISKCLGKGYVISISISPTLRESHLRLCSTN